MTVVQHSLWVGFALRMARRGWPSLPKKSRRRVAALVKDFFRMIRWDDDVERVTDWDGSTWYGPFEDRKTFGVEDPVCVGDEMSEFLDTHNPGNVYDEDREYRRWDELWGARVRCCVRAGLDMASSPSAGVLGFTVGDLRRMYRGNVPEFVYCGWGEDGHCLDTAPDEAGVWL